MYLILMGSVHGFKSLRRGEAKHHRLIAFKTLFSMHSVFVINWAWQEDSVA